MAKYVQFMSDDGIRKCWKKIRNRDKPSIILKFSFSKKLEVLKSRYLWIWVQGAQSHCNILHQRGVKMIDRTYTNWFSQIFD